MKDKNLDRAFESIFDRQGAALPEDLDPKTVEALTRLRDDLRSLREIPEHQMSNERLRDAVLGQGLKPVSAAPWNWLWMPTAAAVLAMAFFTARNLPRPTAADPSDPVIVAATAPAEPPRVELEVRPTPPPVTVATTSRAETPSERPIRRRIERPRSSTRLAFREEASRGPEPGRPTPAAMAAMSSVAAAPSGATASRKEASASRVAGDFASAPPAESIVLIQSEVDVTTGTQNALEVSTENVVVGG